MRHTFYLYSMSLLFFSCRAGSISLFLKHNLCIVEHVNFQFFLRFVKRFPKKNVELEGVVNHARIPRFDLKNTR